MLEYTIRPARPDDQPTIRRLVRNARLDPTKLDWPNFLVADAGGEIIGCVQVRPHGDGSRELGSLLVLPRLQGQHVGAALVQAVLAHETGSVYLLCQEKLVPYYRRFGFQVRPWLQLPRTLKLKTAFAASFRLFGVRVRAMVRYPPPAVPREQPPG